MQRSSTSTLQHAPSELSGDETMNGYRHERTGLTSVAGTVLALLVRGAKAVQPSCLGSWVKIAAESEPGRTYLSGGGIRIKAKSAGHSNGR